MTIALVLIAAAYVLVKSGLLSTLLAPDLTDAQQPDDDSRA